MAEYISEKKGYSTFILRLIAYVITAVGISLTINGPSSIEAINYLSWVAYPIFAYLLAMGFDETSDIIKYFIRLLLFALISEIPYNFYTAGKFLNKNAQNGMFTLCLGLAVLIIVNFIHKKLNNIIISAACCYGVGFGAFWTARHFNCEFWSFGVMIIVIFYISRHVKYSKILQLVFFAILTLAISSVQSISIVLGNYQYSFPYRIFGFLALILIWFSTEKRGPNSLPVKITMYCFYPLLLTIIAIIKNI